MTTRRRDVIMRGTGATAWAVLLGALLGAAGVARADLGWPQRAGGSLADGANATVLDKNGNLVVVGQFQGTARFGETDLVSAGSNDVVVGKVDPGGSWLWAVRAGGTGDDAAFGVAVDKDGDVYVTGTYQGTASFGARQLSSGGTPAVFVAKLGAGGTWDWAEHAYGAGASRGLGIAVSEEKEAFVVGQFDRDLNFPRTAGLFTLRTQTERNSGEPVDATDTDAFVAKLGAGGEWQWILQGGGEWARSYVNTYPANFCCNDNDAVYNVMHKDVNEYWFLFSWCGLADNWGRSYSGRSICQRPVLYSSWGFGFNENQCINYVAGGGALNQTYTLYWWTSSFCIGAWGADRYDPTLPSGVSGSTPAQATIDAAASRLGVPATPVYAPRNSADAAAGIAVRKVSDGTSYTYNYVYLTGRYERLFQGYLPNGSGGRTLAGPVLTDMGSGKKGVFVAKIVEGKPLFRYDGQPSVYTAPAWVWVKDAASTGPNDEVWANDLAMDASGNLFVAGGYRGAPRLGSVQLPDTAAVTGAFVARFSDLGTGGSWLWAKEARATGGTEAAAVAVDTRPSLAARGVYVAGSFQGALTQSTAPPAYQTLTAIGGMDLFASAFNAGDGAVRWAARGGLSDHEYLDAAGGIARGGISADATGTAFLAGAYDRATSLIEGRTMAFTGDGQYVFVPQLPASHWQDYAVSLWFKTGEVSQGLYGVVRRNADGSIPAYDRELWLDANGELNARVWQTGGVEVIRTSGGSLADGQWHHVVHTYGGAAGAQRVYVDGVERVAGGFASSDFTSSAPSGGANGYTIGRANAAGLAFKGKIANVAVSAALDTVAAWDLFRDPGNQPVDNGGKVLFAASGSRDAFLASLTPEGKWRESEVWTVGQEVPRPTGAYPIQPEFVYPVNWQDYFYWSYAEKKLYVTWRTGAIIRWPTVDLTDPTFSTAPRVVTVGAAEWPAKPQVHVAGVPVEVENLTATDFKYNGIVTPTAIRNSDPQASNADDSTTNADGKILRATRPGYTVLLYAVGGQNPTQFPVAFEVVKTVHWNDPSVFRNAQPCVIGKRLTEASHTDHRGRNGYVFFRNSYYDGGYDRTTEYQAFTPQEGAYKRDTRTGPIIPVNRRPAFDMDGVSTDAGAGRDMVVVWYRTNEKRISWPVRPMRYDCRWPSADDPATSFEEPLKIVIASELGSDVYNQPPLDPLDFPEARIYRQEDPSGPGFNPNEEHAAFFPSAAGTGFDALFALRDDLYDRGQKYPSEPYALLKYRNPADGAWSMLVYKVSATDSRYSSFQFHGTAGTPVFPPYPLRIFIPGCTTTKPALPIPPSYWKDKVNNQVWARAAGNMTVYYDYPLQPGFDYPFQRIFFWGIEVPYYWGGNRYNVYTNRWKESAGTCVRWLDRDTGNGESMPVSYSISWPADVPVLQVGETLLTAKRGLPDIVNQAATQVVYDEYVESTSHNPTQGLVQLIDPLTPRCVKGLKNATDPTKTDPIEIPDSIPTFNRNGRVYFEKLPFHLQKRLTYDPRNKWLCFQGYFDEQGMGDPLQLLNVMSGDELAELKKQDGTGAVTDWDKALQALFSLTRNPQQVDLAGTPAGADEVASGQPTLIGVQDRYTLSEGNYVLNDDGSPKPDHVAEPLEALGPGFALTAGAALGEGYVTLAFNNDPSLGALPVSLKVIRVDCGPYLGEIKVIQSDNVFDEQLTLRHSGDFGGNPENMTFEWYYHPDMTGESPSPPPSPETGQLHGWILYPTPRGAVGITLGGANIVTLSDNWFYVRYKGYRVCGNANTPTPWAGAPGSTASNPTAQLAEGWIKRVVRSLNAFEARVKDFHASPTATYASMILQAGERYEGDVAMNNNPDNLNSMGLIEAYETVLRRGISLSIGGTPPIDYGPANNALLLAASRISDFYTLLGNEAYADAADPTIGFGTQGGDYGSAASSIFAFQNQMDSLLEEEATLLRGRDYSTGRPVFNRLVWNFTSGDGEVAYANVYGINDQDGSGVIDEYDARKLYPQGHGDAWGHYLTAMTTYYKLLRHPYYSWEPRAEAVLVAGAPVTVDYLDERKFARIAAAKARTGAEVVDLTYRQHYVDDPAGQWQGYKDTDAERAWGLAEWGRRAGQGAYLDWVVANAILPAVDAQEHAKLIQKIDRTTVLELGEIRSQYTAVQSQLDKADAGYSPVGLAKGVVPFDIDPAQIDEGKTHFEQVYERAVAALDNAVKAFDYASQSTLSLRRNQDTLAAFTRNVQEQEQGYWTRLIEIFGYPYAGDIGPAGSYPNGYDGPDVLHYMYVEPTELTGGAAPVSALNTKTKYDISVRNDFLKLFGINFYIPILQYNGTSSWPESWTYKGEITYSVSETHGFEKPDNFGLRRAEGEVQRALADVYRSRAQVEAAVITYQNHLTSVGDAVSGIQEKDIQKGRELDWKFDQWVSNTTLNTLVGVLKLASGLVEGIGKNIGEGFKAGGECPPKSNGFSNDFTSSIRCALQMTGQILFGTAEGASKILTGTADALDKVKDMIAGTIELEIARTNAAFEVTGMFGQVQKLMDEEPLKRLELYQAHEQYRQAAQHYLDVIAQGERLIEELATFRTRTAAEVQEYRYQDMTFRVFRNDAVQKYRAQFDLAARYAYLAATAYDYETNLVHEAGNAGTRFLTDIVRERALGQVVDGVPVAGSPGLANHLARLRQNFDVLRGQLGFNNPQQETSRFSLRTERFRINASDPAWPDPLDNVTGNTAADLWADAIGGAGTRVPDLWQVPEFRRFCRPFAPESAGPQPGIVIPFGTSVVSRRNFFGWPLGAGDSTYDPTNFATRVRSVGVWFTGYEDAGLSATPRVYLVPAGTDVLRSPTSGDFRLREWRVVDQKLPVPFPIVAADLRDPAWTPVNDSLSDMLGGVRRLSSFRAHADPGALDTGQMTADSRLVGRSVWNSKWLLIIPGATLHYDPDVGLQRFVDHVSDIKLSFQTYGYSGN